MTRQIPQGNTLRPLKGIIIDLGNSLDEAQSFWPADPVERAADKVLRKARARPVARSYMPPLLALAWFLFGAAVALAGMGVALIVADMIATGAATAVEAQRVAGW